MKLKSVFGLTIALLLAAIPPCPGAGRRFKGVVSDGSWKYSSVEKRGWFDKDFDDSSWRDVNAPCANAWSGGEPIPWQPDGGALPIWGGPDDGTVYLRKVFSVDAVPDGPVVACLQVDDDYEFYINGRLVARNDDGVWSAPGEDYDVTKHIKAGKNVVAVKGIDRGFGEHVLFSLKSGREVGGRAAPVPRPVIGSRIKLPLEWPGMRVLFLVFFMALAIAAALYAMVRFGPWGRPGSRFGAKMRGVGRAVKWFIEQL